MSTQEKLGELKVQELERRVAPLVPMLKTTPVPDTGDSGGDVIPESVDQPGGSDGQRNKLFHENQE